MHKLYGTTSSKLDDRIFVERRENEQRKKQAFQIQLNLIECQHVSRDELVAAANYLRIKDYQDVVVERSLGKWCGYPICGKSLTTTIQPGRKYRVSLSQRKVHDIQELHHFCSPECAIASKSYMRQLSEEPVYLRDDKNTRQVELWETKEQDNSFQER